MRPNIKWMDPSQPQTLQVAVIIFYIRAVFGVLFGAVFSPFGLLITLGEVGAAIGIANEKRNGYVAGIIVAALSVLFALAVFRSGGGLNSLISLMFDAALLTALLHPQSREYQKIWFR